MDGTKENEGTPHTEPKIHKKKGAVAVGIKCTREGEGHRSGINEQGRKGIKLLLSAWIVSCFPILAPRSECGPHPHQARALAMLSITGR